MRDSPTGYCECGSEFGCSSCSGDVRGPAVYRVVRETASGPREMKICTKCLITETDDVKEILPDLSMPVEPFMEWDLLGSVILSMKLRQSLDTND